MFNWALAEWKRQYETGGKPNATALKKQFNAIRREQFPWSYEVTKCAVEGAFMDVGTAFKNFFEGQSRGRKTGYPKFKSKKRSRQSFYLANDKFTVGDHWIDVPKLGRVNMAEKLRFSGKILWIGSMSMGTDRQTWTMPSRSINRSVPLARDS